MTGCCVGADATPPFTAIRSDPSMPNLRALAVAKAAWLEEGQRRYAKRHTGDELEFLPAALEVMETPASPAGRAIAWAIMVFFIGGLIWAGVGTIDVVAVAQ